MNNAFFFQTQQIPDSSSIFDQFKQQKIFFSYFPIDQNYYLFLYGQESSDINRFYQSVEVIQELDSKQRKIRSLRGFFLYALEIMGKAEDSEILQTNLQPFFWRKVKNIIRQNKKAALQEFLFGYESAKSNSSQGSNPQIEEMIKTLQNQVNSLQDRISDLETTLENSKYALSGTLDAPDGTKIIQQGDYSTLEVKKGPSLPENESEVRDPTSQRKGMESKSVSEASKSPLTPLSESQQYNIPSNEEKALNRPNFVTLGKIPEEEQIEIIKTGFQLQAEGKLSLKKYYESTDPNISFVRSYTNSGRKEVLNQQIYITVQFYLVDFMKMVDAKQNTYQRKQFLEFFDNLMKLPPYQKQFSDKEFRKLLFFPVVNAIQTTERGPWIIQVSVAQTLMHDFYPFHFPPSFFSCSSNINLQVKFSIIRAFAQEDSLKKTYLLQSFFNRYAKRSNSIQAQVKREVLQEFHNLLKYKTIQPEFEFSVDGNYFTQKYNIQLEDIRSYKIIHFYEIIHY